LILTTYGCRNDFTKCTGNISTVNVSQRDERSSMVCWKFTAQHRFSFRQSSMELTSPEFKISRKLIGVSHCQASSIKLCKIFVLSDNTDIDLITVNCYIGPENGRILMTSHVFPSQIYHILDVIFSGIQYTTCL
jgi:hypothetical protein